MSGLMYLKKEIIFDCNFIVFFKYLILELLLFLCIGIILLFVFL